MAKTVKLADIGKRLSVSTVTVSKALSGQKGVSEQMRQRIIRLADEMGYVKSLSENKGKKKSFIIGIIVAERYLQENQSFYWRLYKQLSKMVIDMNCFTMLEVISYEAEKNNEFPRIVTEKKVDGIIVMGAFKVNYAHYFVKNAQLPVINLDTTSAGEFCDSIVTNNLMGGYMMTNYLFWLGHKKIGFVGTRLTTTSIDDRYLGYLKSLMEHGVQFRRDWLIDDRDREFGKMDYEKMFQLPVDMPTAFFCNCDISAGMLIRKLVESGYSVPEDVSVVGFDNFVNEQFAGIGLTTYEINTNEMARRAAELLVDKINNQDFSIGMLMLRGKFIERRSAKAIGEPVPFV